MGDYQDFYNLVFSLFRRILVSKKVIDNISFNYELYGRGHNAVVFIAGYTGGIDSWREMADFLAPESRVLIFDSQGIGATEDRGEGLAVEQMADKIHKLYSALGLRSPILVGFAMGASIAQAVAYQFPNDVSKLILVSSLMTFDSIAKANCERLCKLREAGHDRAFRDAASLIYDTCYSNNFKKKTPKNRFVEDFWPVLKTLQTAKGQRRQVEALKALNSSAWVNKIAAPTLIINQIEDQYAPVEAGKALAKTIGRNAQFTELNCGHAVLDEKMGELKWIFKRFIGGLDASISK